MRTLVAMQEDGWNRQWGGAHCSNHNIFEISYPRQGRGAPGAAVGLDRGGLYGRHRGRPSLPHEARLPGVDRV